MIYFQYYEIKLTIFKNNLKINIKIIMQHYRAGRYVDALKELIMILEKGKRKNNNIRLRDYYVNQIGKLMHKDILKEDFLNWLNREVKKGNSYAQYFLGDLYYYGVLEDKKKGVELWTLSAQARNSYACYILALEYFSGTYVKKDNIKGRNLLLTAAKNGNRGAFYYLIKWQNELDSEHKINFRGDVFNKYLEHDRLMNKLRKLERENERLRIELDYRPDGQGYHKAKEHAENVFDQLRIQDGINCS